MENQKLPNTTAVLILGIFSILTCCCYGFISIILGIVGLVLAKKDTVLYNQNPDLYSNYNNLKIGKVLSVIGVVLGTIYLILMIWMIVTFGYDTLQDPELLKEEMNRYFGIQ
ncbi:CCC motif membrane protein [Flavobacterium lacisediminis]|uniref:CCC motif membrane protein n=1 Tax=Flavobacterium lacisediminis TaxID=2989705 RepID=A0ABT3EJ49_9FLAO|nr:CCC motif membrane protein [Flavobacterium lacisediminis]MCW1148609.1 CCC motif membrane protein [Flavobacterium lacisediminis]